MRKFDQLTPAQQEKAAAHELTLLLTEIVQGAIRFNDKLNGDDLQARIDKALAQADKMKTPWFAHEYVMEACKEDLEGLARSKAEDALYPEPEEYVSQAELA